MVGIEGVKPGFVDVQVVIAVELIKVLDAGRFVRQ